MTNSSNDEMFIAELSQFAEIILASATTLI